jgi:hypothetical protein
MPKPGNAIDVVVVGGGPAGLVASIQAASAGRQVVLLERTPRCGRKLLLTGNGRCNLTVDRSARDFVADCGDGGRFLHNAVSRFDPDATRAFFASLGVPVVREPDGRCFPASGRAADVRDALLRRARAAGVQVVGASRVRAIEAHAGGLRVASDRGVVVTAGVVLATGGRSVPGTGSSGDGYDLARALGHRVVAPRPGEVPLVAGPSWIRELAGLALPDAAIEAVHGGQRARTRGAVLFAHFGLTGPAVLDVSRQLTRWLDDGPVELRVDLVPDVAAADLDRELADAAGRRGLRAAMRDRVPDRLALALAVRARPGDPSGPPSAAERRAAVAALKGLALKVTGTRGWDEAVVTVGGIDTAEVDPRTLASRLVPGLHFAGEVLDLDGPRGGYNLQIAWSTGWVAGLAAARR